MSSQILFWENPPNESDESREKCDHKNIVETKKKTLFFRMSHIVKMYYYYLTEMESGGVKHQCCICAEMFHVHKYSLLFRITTVFHNNPMLLCLTDVQLTREEHTFLQIRQRRRKWKCLSTPSSQLMLCFTSEMCNESDNGIIL